jgi:hypothetical protein
MDSQAVKNSQDPFQAVYFLWFNSHSNKDIRLNFLVRSGLADVYISTFTERDSESSLTLAERLPTSKRDPWTYWIFEENRQTSNI